MIIKKISNHRTDIVWPALSDVVDAGLISNPNTLETFQYECNGFIDLKNWNIGFRVFIDGDYYDNKIVCIKITLLCFGVTLLREKIWTLLPD